MSNHIFEEGDELRTDRGVLCDLFPDAQAKLGVDSDGYLHIEFQNRVRFSFKTLQALAKAYTADIEFEVDPGHPDWSEWTGGEPGSFTITVRMCK